MKRAVTIILASIMLIAALAGCQAGGSNEPPTLVAAYNAQPSYGTWLLFENNEYTTVRTAQVHLYDNGTYVYQDVYYDWDIFDPTGEEQASTGWNLAPTHISITTTGTYTIEEDPESEGKSYLTLSRADRLIYSASEPFFDDSQGFFDSADDSTRTAFSSNTTWGSDPDKLFDEYGAEKVLPVNTLTMAIEASPGDPLYQQGHITFKHP